MHLRRLTILFALGCATTETTTPPTAAARPAAPEAAPAPSTAATTTEATTVPAAWTSCQADTDCTIVQMGCCDHCNGGWALSVHAASVAEATARYKETACEGACTERGCMAPKAACHEGTCARKEQRFDAAGGETWEVIDNVPR